MLFVGIAKHVQFNMTPIFGMKNIDLFKLTRTIATIASVSDNIIFNFFD